MARYGRDSYGRRPERGGMGNAPRPGGGNRYGGRYGGEYSGGWDGPQYGIYFDEPRSGWSPRYEGWGNADRHPGARDEGSDGDRIRASEIMTRNPEVVTPDSSLMEVAQKMRELDVGIIPVVEDEKTLRLAGVITDRDIAVRAAAEGKDMKKARVADFMSPRVETVRESAHVRDVFSVMKRERVRRVPVTDEQGALVGIIAQADLAVTYAGLDLQRETEVEEVIERISEPARPRWGREEAGASGRRFPAVSRPSYDHDFGDRLRDGWRALRREARQVIGRGYDRGWW